MFSVVSLFSGCGGFDLGFKIQGHSLIAAFEIDDQAIMAYSQNVSTNIVKRDLSHPNLTIPKSDIVIAGPPCQGFSNIGKLDASDHRNNMLGRACDIAISNQPKIIVLENVLGLISSRNLVFLDTAVSILTGAGYFVEVLKVNCDEFGLPQRRKRIFVIARRNSAPFNTKLEKEPRKTVSDAFGGIDYGSAGNPPELPQNSRSRRIAEVIGQGQKLCNVRNSKACVHTWQISRVFGHVSAAEKRLLNKMIGLRRTQRRRSFGDADPVSIERIEKELGSPQRNIINRLLEKKYLRMVDQDIDLMNTFNGTFRRLSSDDVSPTVDTQFGNPRMFLHPTKHRGLVPEEASILQGFPPKFMWPYGMRHKFRLIGNAVPPPIAEKVAVMAQGLLNS